jgi:uncharacterized membrane protein
MSTNTNVKKLAQAALLAALAYVGFQFFRIDIPVGTERTAFHFGNAFVVLAALLLGPVWGGLAGAVGLTIADLTSGYITSAPKTFILKLLIGLIAGWVFHGLFKADENTSGKRLTAATVAASAASLGFNVVADPLFGYFYKKYLFGIPQEMAAALSKMGAATTFVNAIVGAVAASIFFLALFPILKRSGLLLFPKKKGE